MLLHIKQETNEEMYKESALLIQKHNLHISTNLFLFYKN